jgi:hypothetical protein
MSRPVCSADQFDEQVDVSLRRQLTGISEESNLAQT